MWWEVAQMVAHILSNRMIKNTTSAKKNEPKETEEEITLLQYGHTHTHTGEWMTRNPCSQVPTAEHWRLLLQHVSAWHGSISHAAACGDVDLRSVLTLCPHPPRGHMLRILMCADITHFLLPVCLHFSSSPVCCFISFCSYPPPLSFLLMWKTIFEFVSHKQTLHQFLECTAPSNHLISILQNNFVPPVLAAGMLLPLKWCRREPETLYQLIAELRNT